MSEGTTIGEKRNITNLPERKVGQTIYFCFFFIYIYIALLELLVLRICQRSSAHQGAVLLAKDVLLNPEHSFNMVLEQWTSQLACFAYKLQSLQLDMAEFACVNAIMLFEQGKIPFHK